jgi:hypothetical protein
MKERVVTQNSADESQVKAAGRKEELRREREVNDLKFILSTASGRRYMHRLIVEIAGLYRSSYLGAPTGRETDPAFLEGARNLGLQLFSEIRAHCPEEWALAEKEQRLLSQQERS